MKSYIYIFLLFFLANGTFAQSLLKKPKLPIQNQESAQSIETVSSFTNAYDVNWNTKVFNPYKGEIPPEFPLELDFSGEEFSMPVSGVVTTSRFGWRKGKAHNGVDLDLETGDLVKTVMDGKVRFAKYYSGFGNVVVVRHSNGLETIYGHLSKILVEPGDMVFAGFAVGLGGNTGNSRGSHLHFEARYKNIPINPEYLFDLEEKQALQTQEKILVTEYWAQPNKHRANKKSNIVIHQPVFQVKQSDEPIVSNTKVIHRNSIVKQTKENSLTSASKKVEALQSTEQSNSFSKVKKASLITKKQVASSLRKATSEELANVERRHIIQKGENVRTIAEKYKTTIEKLCQVNGLTRTSKIRVGQVLLLP